MRVLGSMVLRPLVARLGTIGAGMLIAAGADAELSNQFAVALGAVLLIGLDLVLAWFFRQRTVEKAVQEVVRDFNDPNTPNPTVAQPHPVPGSQLNGGLF